MKRISIFLITLFLFLTGLSAATDPYPTSLNLVNEIIYISEQVISESNNVTYLDEAYSHLYNNLNLTLVDDETRSQVANMMDAIEKYRMIEIKRDRLNTIYDYQKSMNIAAAVPDPINLIGSLAMITANPVGAIAGLVGTAASSATMYAAASAQMDLSMLEQQWELSDEARANLADININLFDYASKFANNKKDEVTTREILNENLVKDFVNAVNDTDLRRSINYLEGSKETYSFFPTYWLELAHKYYINEQFNECLESIKYYENHFDYRELYRYNYRYAQILVEGIDALYKTVDDVLEYKDVLLSRLEIIEGNTRTDDWLQNYFVATVYLSLIDTGLDNEVLYKKAIDVLNKNWNYLTKEQEKLNNEYCADLPTEKSMVKNSDGDAKKEEIQKYYNELEKERETDLPSFNPAFETNLRLLYSIYQAQGKGVNELADDYSYLMNYIPVPQLRSAIFGENLGVRDGVIEINKKGFSNRKFEITIPASFINVTTEFEVKLVPEYADSAYGKLKFDNILKHVNDNTEYAGSISVKKVNRNNSYNLDDFVAVLEIELSEEFVGNRGSDYSLNLLITTADCPIEIEFRGKKISQLGLSKIYKNWTIPSYFNGFTETK